MNPKALTSSFKGKKNLTGKKLQLLSFLTFSFILFSASAQTVSTFAGNGIAGYNGDGGPATAAELNFPFDVKVDPSNNLFIADYNNFAVRKVDAITGIITTVAGIGVAGFAGDGGQATACEMGNAAAVALDNVNGLLYIATASDSRIRAVNLSTGIISTITGIGAAGYTGDGGPASAAELDYPEGVEVDSAGNVLIADIYNHVIRRVIISTGIINTYAGNGVAGLSGDGGPATAAELNVPLYVRKDMNGNMFISDGTTNVIRRVDKITGTITTVAGNSIAGYSGDGGLATAAEINSPGGVGFDNSGNMFITDWGNSLIREVAEPSTIISSVVGNDVAGFSGDGGPATDAELNRPEALVLDAAGNMYIADDGNNRVRMVGSISTGVNPLAKNSTVNIYPNPSSGIFTMQPSVVGGKLSVEVYNVSGEEVYSKFLISNSSFLIDLSGHPNGIYLYKIIANTGKIIGEGKLIIEK